MKIFVVDNSLEIYYDGYRREHLFVLEDAMAKEEKVMNVNRGMDPVSYTHLTLPTT